MSNKYLWFDPPTSDQKRCWGSPHGLVVTLGPDYEAYLVHVRKEEQIALPPLNPIRALAQLEEWFRLVHKFIILNDPSDEKLFLVFAIFGPVNHLAFARVAFNRGGDGAALNRRGQGQWAIVTHPENLKFNDVACFEDKIYALCDNGKEVCLELDGPLAAEVQVIGTSNNIGLESNGPQVPIWSELPADMIGEIGNQIPSSKDIKAILMFCNPCNSACFETTTWFLFPWLMLSNKLDSDLQYFFNLCNNKCLRLELPTSDQKRCWGSPHGLVVTLGPDYEAYLVHVRKEDQIALPPLNPIRALAQLEEWFRLVHKFIILNDPSDEKLFLVFAIFGPVNRLAFARVAFNRGGDGAALNRRGQGQWAIVTNPDNLKFNDVECLNNKIYALCDNGLGCLDLDAPLAAEVRVIAPLPSEEDIGTPQKLYLMKSQQNLIAVFRYGFHTPSKMRHETIYFLVYKFNFSALNSEENWEETELDDCTAFVGDGNSWCITTSTIPCRSNCIYFTDDNWEWQMYPGVAYGGRDVGVFNIAQRKIQQLPFGKDNPRFYSRPNWVTPSNYPFR